MTLPPAPQMPPESGLGVIHTDIDLGFAARPAPSCDGRPHRAQVAQLVEQRTENPRVGGSIPPLGTIFSITYEYTVDH